MQGPTVIRVLVGATAFLAAFCGAANAQGGYSYWISLRDMTVPPPESFVSTSTTQTDQQNVPIQGCDGNAYYLSSADAQSVQNALTNDDTVQMNVTPGGQQPDDSAAIICVIQSAE